MRIDTRNGRRVDGYAPVEDYALIGDGRTCALVALDGSIDWLCLPDVSSPSVFARLLDAERGGSFQLAPDVPFDVERRYLDGTNVLETTFRTSSGTVRVTDALTVTTGGTLAPLRELVRRVEGVEGEVALRWRFEPRFGYAARRTSLGRRGGRHVAFSGADAVAIGAWGAGEPRVANTGVEAEFSVAGGETALLSLAAANGEPLVLAPRPDVERRLAETIDFWRDWSRRCEYGGRWRDAVLRSALALKLCVFAPTGAVVAAPTTSLPEEIGGVRNWDYRFAWIRDASYTVSALLRLGREAEARAFFWWLAHATALTRPEVKVVYGVDGRIGAQERALQHLDGYRGSRPARVGNGAAEQTQLDVYGALIDAVWTYVETTGEFEADSGRSLARVADWVCDHWGDADSGIWEVRSPPAHFVHSKAMCWLALDRACKLAERGFLPDRRRRWRAGADAVREWIETHGWDAARGSYVRAPALRELDASLLTLSLFEYDAPDRARLAATVDAIRAELAEGPLVWRYRGDDGIEGGEGAFLTCSFWLAGALAKTGRGDEAAALMDELVALANDVGLFAEEAAPDRAFLGNFPQALVHLALVNAAIAIETGRAAA